MACLNPQLVYIEKDDKGKSFVKFYGSLDRYFNYEVYHGAFLSGDKEFMLVPCGHCRACQFSHAKEWSLRCKDELSLYDASCFLTLTYNDEHLPENGELCKRDYQLFLKRLRRLLRMKLGLLEIRYFGCGEYGRENLRPHYHFIIFGWCPSDGVPWSNSGRAVCYRSAFLDSLWMDKSKTPIGFATFGSVTDESINYVCRYSLKKLDLDVSSKKVKPFTCCSSRPAVGLRWFEKFSRELLVKSADGAILRYGHVRDAHLVGLPRYYSKKLSLDEGTREALRHFLASGRPLLSFEELCRRNDYSDYLAKLHNAHYGLDVLAHVPKPQTEEKSENE